LIRSFVSDDSRPMISKSASFWQVRHIRPWSLMAVCGGLARLLSKGRFPHMFFEASFCMANHLADVRGVAPTTREFLDDARRKVLGDLVLESEEIAQSGCGSKDKSNLKIRNSFAKNFLEFLLELLGMISEVGKN